MPEEKIITPKRYYTRLQRARPKLKREDLQDIKTYLTNPTKNGVWTLEANWISSSPINLYIEQKLKSYNDKYVATTEELKKRQLIKPAEYKELLEKTDRLSFIFDIFLHALEDEEKTTDQESRHILEQTEEDFILQIVDFSEIRTQFSEAYSYFKEEIYFKDFYPNIKDNEIFYIKNGFVLIASEDKKNRENDFYEQSTHTRLRPSKTREKLFLNSLKIESLEAIGNFFKTTGKLEEIKIIPEFSPEEKVFDPYIALLSAGSKSICQTHDVRQFVNKALSEYDSQNFPASISSISLAAEDLLTQVYETLFREVCPKKLTLGQLRDQIVNKVAAQITGEITIPSLKQKDPSQIYLTLKKIEKTKEQIPKDIHIELLREIVGYTKDENKRLTDLYGSLKQKTVNITIFTKYIKENVEELVDYRNAVSHLSRLAIGEGIALRSIYCCVTLLLWWEEEKAQIDWRKTEDEIIRDLVTRSDKK